MFLESMSANWTFRLDFRHFCVMSEILTLLHGFQTPCVSKSQTHKYVAFRQVRISNIQILDIYCFVFVNLRPNLLTTVACHVCQGLIDNHKYDKQIFVLYYFKVYQAFSYCSRPFWCSVHEDERKVIICRHRAKRRNFLLHFSKAVQNYRWAC